MRININFASKDYVVARKLYLALVLGIAAAAAVFAVNYEGYRDAAQKGARLSGYLQAQEMRADEVNERLAVLKKAIGKEEVKAAAREAGFTNAAIRRRAFSWTRFLDRLEDVVPDGVGVTNIRPDFNSLDVDISGTALDMARLTEFVERLTKSPYFEDIPPVFQTTEEVVDKDVGKTLQVFNLRIRYNPEGADTPAASGKKGR